MAGLQGGMKLRHVFRLAVGKMRFWFTFEWILFRGRKVESVQHRVIF